MANPRPGFEIRESRSDHTLRLSLTGELDLAATPILEDRLTSLRAKRSPVVLDLSNLAFIDSTGMRLLVRMVGHARTTRWQLQIEPRVTPAVMQLLRLMHVECILTSSGSITAAA